MSENFEQNDTLERQPLLLLNGPDNTINTQTNGSVNNTPQKIETKKEPSNKYKCFFFTLIFISVIGYFLALIMMVYTVYFLKSKAKENIYSLNDLIVEEDNSMRLTIDPFELPRFIPVSFVNLGFNFLLFPLFNLMKFEYFLPDCNNNPTIPLNLPMNVEFLRAKNNSIVPLITTKLDNNFIPYQLSHQICVATEEYVLTPLDLMIEYVSRNKAEKDREGNEGDDGDEDENINKKKEVYWKDQMKIGVQPYKLPLKTIEIPGNLIRNSTFIQKLEILNKVDFNNTKFDIFNMRLSGDFFIEITLDMLKNVDLINFKMLKGTFIINLQESEKEMLLLEIPQWQECTVHSKQSDGLDMIIELSLQEAAVKVLDQNEFTKFGKRWLWDKQVDIGVSSDIDLIISDDKWLGSMVLRDLKSHDKAELRA
ncbi:hypothetical protein HANVADRAFT_50997 [Hanseniaspora valbyensis NRRL Y-1626]|uniref:Uncharacterized protein n=1 Tax=Hanseniaspora valbyensis NRRL Y-1626 TaxID=766949 RepID=A0A1B7TJZ3_9ASCO|nr:hypothetical protein HANVADRAFT_50997 [Hanseniaspora valbyensis NRRL Y-1626]